MGRKTWIRWAALAGAPEHRGQPPAGPAIAGRRGVSSLEAARVRAEQWAREQGVGELMLIGGAQLYGQALEKGLVSRMYLTRVELSPEGMRGSLSSTRLTGAWCRVSRRPRKASLRITSRCGTRFETTGAALQPFAGEPAPKDHHQPCGRGFPRSSRHGARNGSARHGHHRPAPAGRSA